MPKKDTSGKEEPLESNIEKVPEINTTNEFMLGSQLGVIRPLQYPQFTTRQQAYRFAAWLVTMAEFLPPEDEIDHSFAVITKAIQST